MTTLIGMQSTLSPIGLSLLAQDFSLQHLVGNQVGLPHICVPAAHHRTAGGQRRSDT